MYINLRIFILLLQITLYYIFTSSKQSYIQYICTLQFKKFQKAAPQLSYSIKTQAQCLNKYSYTGFEEFVQLLNNKNSQILKIIAH